VQAPRAEARPPRAPEQEPASDVEMTHEDGEGASRQAEALKEKDLGNESYKKKDFDAAIAHYNKALELYDRDMTFLTNRAAVFFEQVRPQLVVSWGQCGSRATAPSVREPWGSPRSPSLGRAKWSKAGPFLPWTRCRWWRAEGRARPSARACGTDWHSVAERSTEDGSTARAPSQGAAPAPRR
jgi:hypothetical protein